MTITTSLLWVCVDCMYARELPGENPDATGDEWSNYSDVPATDITAGMMYGTEACNGRHSTDEWDDATDTDHEEHSEYCVRLEFSTRHCDACGSHLAGYRQAYTLWERE